MRNRRHLLDKKGICLFFSLFFVFWSGKTISAYFHGFFRHGFLQERVRYETQSKGPFTDRFIFFKPRANIHSIDYLLQQGVSALTGEVECEKCKFSDTVTYDLKQKFAEVAEIIAAHKDEIYERRPMAWMRPTFPTCPRCRRADPSFL